MQHLEDDHIRIRELLARRTRAALCVLVLGQMPLERIHVIGPIVLAVRVVLLLLLLAELGVDELGAPVDRVVAHAVDPEHLVLGVAVVGVAEDAAEVADDGVGFGHDLPVELDDGDVACWVEAALVFEGGLDLGGEFVEAVPYVGVGDAGVDEEEPDYLSAAFAEEVEVVDCGHAADFLVGGTGFADLSGGGHDGRLMRKGHLSRRTEKAVVMYERAEFAIISQVAA